MRFTILYIWKKDFQWLILKFIEANSVVLIIRFENIRDFELKLKFWIEFKYKPKTEPRFYVYLDKFKWKILIYLWKILKLM